MSHSIKHRQSECLADKLIRDEYFTMSVTILSGNLLRGKASIIGPFSSISTTSSSQLYGNSQKAFHDATKNRKTGDFYQTYDISFEDIFDMDDEDDDEVFHDDDVAWDDDMDDVSFREYYYEMDDIDDVNDDYEWLIDDSMSDAEIEEVKKKHEARQNPEEKEARRKKQVEEKKRNFQIALEERKNLKVKRDAKREELMRKKEKKRQMTKEEKDLSRVKSGEAVEKTHRAPTDGWYMVCLEANYNEILAQLEMRKSSEVGGVNRKTGHLSSYEHHEMAQRERKLFNVQAEEIEKAKKGEEGDQKKDGGIEAKDLENSKSQIQRLNRMLNEIKGKQQNERNRLSIHSALNEHSHSRMVLSSLFETIFYILVSGFQVYTIRKWFRGNPILGY